LIQNFVKLVLICIFSRKLSDEASEVDLPAETKQVAAQKESERGEPQSFADQLAAKFKMAPKNSPRVAKRMEKQDIEETMESADKQEPVKPVKKKSFLFDDSDSDDDLFKPKKPSALVQPSTKPTESSVATTTPLILENPATAKPITVESSKPVPPPLLDEIEEDDEDDLFFNINKKTQAEPQFEKENIREKSLFDSSDSEDDLFSNITDKGTNGVTSKVPLVRPIGGVSMFGGLDPKKLMRRPTRKCSIIHQK
jgi:hypothetical protein